MTEDHSHIKILCCCIHGHKTLSVVITGPMEKVSMDLWGYPISIKMQKSGIKNLLHYNVPLND